ncbi:hypothetical protein HAX54_038153, partial [Datura stramonium]|nr:hypothetical protein [Datura stramonium]
YHQSSGGLLGASSTSLGSQGFGWEIDEGVVTAATSCFKVPTLLSRKSTIEHRLANSSLVVCKAFLMAPSIMEGRALANNTS